MRPLKKRGHGASAILATRGGATRVRAHNLPFLPMSQPLVILFNRDTSVHLAPSGVCGSLKVLLIDISGSVEARNKAIRAVCASILLLWGFAAPLQKLPAANGSTALISAMDAARVKAAELCPSGNIEYAVVTDGADNATWLVKATAPGVVPLAGAAALAVRDTAPTFGTLHLEPIATVAAHVNYFAKEWNMNMHLICVGADATAMAAAIDDSASKRSDRCVFVGHVDDDANVLDIERFVATTMASGARRSGVLKCSALGSTSALTSGGVSAPLGPQEAARLDVLLTLVPMVPSLYGQLRDVAAATQASNPNNKRWRACTSSDLDIVASAAFDFVTEPANIDKKDVNVPKWFKGYVKTCGSGTRLSNVLKPTFNSFLKNLARDKTVKCLENSKGGHDTARGATYRVVSASV